MQGEYKQRRKNLGNALKPDSVVIIPAANEKIRSGDATYRFCQDSNFFYLTGFNEPDAVLVLVKEKKLTSILFTRERNIFQEQWTGRILGTQDAKVMLKMDETFDIADIDKLLPEIMLNKDFVYFPLGEHTSFEHKIFKIFKNLLKVNNRKGAKPPNGILDVKPLIAELRIIKSAQEIKLMQKAADVSVAAHLSTMQNALNCKFEYELEALFAFEMLRRGARDYAYEPIIASGANATILHYGENNKAIDKSSLILIDAGAKWQGYAADITRTFPANGKFTIEQRAIYELVLEAQNSALQIIKPGVLINKIQDKIVKVITKGLVKLGILKGEVDKLITNQAYKEFYMHSFGHWLGLDVHDCGAYKLDDKWRVLEPGMVLTVEPGIYLSSRLGVADKWLNIGVRIEDDIVITDDGYKNLTAALAVDSKDIEAIVSG